MTICKYFMDGYCKYGSRCRFEHVNPYDGYDSRRHTDYSSNEGQPGVSILRSGSTVFGGPQPVFNQGLQGNKHHFGQAYNQPQSQQTRAPPQSPLSKFNVQEIMQVVARDILQAEKGNQWLLSAYSPGKDLKNIPGLEDHSPEELRWECYKAVQNSSLPLWQAIVQQLQTNVVKINNDLKKKDTGYAIIDRWLREEVQQSSNMAPSYESSSFNVTSVPSYPQPTTNSSFSFSLPPQQQQTTNVQMFPTSGSVFVGSSQTTLPSQTQSFAPQAQYHVENRQAYSSIEDLIPNELEAFKADRFVIGSIPTKSPPKELCNA